MRPALALRLRALLAAVALLALLSAPWQADAYTDPRRVRCDDLRQEMDLIHMLALANVIEGLDLLEGDLPPSLTYWHRMEDHPAIYGSVSTAIDRHSPESRFRWTRRSDGSTLFCGTSPIHQIAGRTALTENLLECMIISAPSPAGRLAGREMLDICLEGAYDSRPLDPEEEQEVAAPSGCASSLRRWF